MSAWGRRDGLPRSLLLQLALLVALAACGSARPVKPSSVADVSNAVAASERHVQGAAFLRALKQTDAPSRSSSFCVRETARNGDDDDAQDGSSGRSQAELDMDLWQAAQDGDLAAAQAALDAGACVEARLGRFGTPALQEAAGGGHEDVARLLLSSGADVNGKSTQGSTALFRAAVFKHSGMVRLLAAAGADLEARRVFDGATPLVAVAALAGNAEIVAELLQVGADVDAANNDGSTALFFAAMHGDEETARVLVESGADVDKARSNGATPLVIAAQKGTPGVMKVLLDAGANPTIANDFGTTPLHLAAFRLGGVGEEMAELLLAGGNSVEVDARDDDGRTPLMWAARFGNAGMAGLLLEAGADASAVDGGRRDAEALVCTCTENEGDEKKLQCPTPGCELPATSGEVLEALRQ